MQRQIPRSTGFRITGYDGREAWRQLHAAADRLGLGAFMVFFHNVVNFGLGKPLFQTTVRQLHQDVVRPDRLGVAPLLRAGSAMDDLRRAVVAVVARDERVACPHCRSHGLKWFHALLDLVRAEGRPGAAFYRPAVMLHFVGPYRAFCRVLAATASDSAPPLPPPDVTPCAQRRRGPGRPRVAERPVPPMVGVAPASPRPQSPSRTSAVSAAEWRTVVPEPDDAADGSDGTSADEPEPAPRQPEPAPKRRRAAAAMGVDWV